MLTNSYFNPFHTKSIFLEFVHQMLSWFHGKPAQTFDEQIQEKFIISIN